MKNKKGFTLIELLAAVVVFLSLATLAVISIKKVSDNSKIKTAKVSLKTIVNAFKNEDLINHIEGDHIDVFSINDKTSNNKLSNLIQNTSSLKDGLISVYGSTLVQANLCINGYSVKYYYEDDDITTYEDDRYCNYSSSDGFIYTDKINENNKIVGLSYVNPEYLKFLKLSDEEKASMAIIPDNMS